MLWDTNSALVGGGGLTVLRGAPTPTLEQSKE